MKFKCQSRKCKKKEWVPVIFKEVPPEEKPAGITSIAYTVRCFMCDNILTIVSHSEYTDYMKPGQGFKLRPNLNALNDECYLCGAVGKKTIPPLVRLAYVWFELDKFGTRMVCTDCLPYPPNLGFREIVADEKNR